MMNNSKKLTVMELLQNTFDLLKERQNKEFIKTKAIQDYMRVEDKIKGSRKSLRELVDDNGTYIHIDLDGTIFKVSKLPNDEEDVEIEEIHIDCRRVGLKK